jgi:hypothetical protein
MKATIKTTPAQDKIIKKKLKEAKELRLAKLILYDSKLNAQTKINMITNLLQK